MEWVRATCRFFVARICHALGLKADTMKNPLRFIGAMLQVLVTAVATVWAITIAL